jgi:hypothetical protein
VDQWWLDPEVIRRVRERVIEGEGCWSYRGATSVRIRNRRVQLRHAIYAVEFKRPPFANALVMLCSRPSCMNPYHCIPATREIWSFLRHQHQLR